MVSVTMNIVTIETGVTVSMDSTLDFYKIPAEDLFSVEQVCLYEFWNQNSCRGAHTPVWQVEIKGGFA